jgi:hypothetical protein
MATHLLTWNPDRYSWRELPDLSYAFMHGRPVTARLSCGSNRRVRVGDRFFLLRLNRFPVAIFASGRVTRGVHEIYDKVAQDTGRSGTGLFIGVRFDVLVDPDGPQSLTRRQLSRGALNRFRWESGGSGRTLAGHVAAALEAAWVEHFASMGKRNKGLAILAPAAGEESPPDAAGAVQESAAGDCRMTAEAAAAEQEARMFDALFTHYLAMVEAGVRGEILGHARHLADLMNEFGALDEGAIREYYAQTGGVLMQCGLPFLDVFPPSPRPDRQLRRRLVRFLSERRGELFRVWLGDDAVRCVRQLDELVDVQGAWAPPPLDDDFRVEAWLAGQARFPAFGGFARRERRWHLLHEAGCRFVLAFERARLKQMQRNSLARRVRILEPGARGDGYDIVSFEASGETRYIGVAATQYSRRFPFMLTPATLLASFRHGDRFCLYRVFNYCWEAKLYIVQGDLRERLRLLPRSAAASGVRGPGPEVRV